MHLKYQLQHGMINSNSLMDHILYQIFYSISDYFECILKNNETLTDNPPMRICINRTENRITFEIKTRYHLEL